MAKGDEGPLAGPVMPRPQPVFVDSTGIRRRWFVVLGAGTSVVLAMAVGVVAAGFVAGGSGHLPALPGTAERPDAVVVGRSEPAATPSGQARPGSRTRSAAATPAASPAGSAAVAATQSPAVAVTAATPAPIPPGHRNTAAPGQAKKS